MDRREKLLVDLDLSQLDGAEIGPLNRPIVSREQGRIFYIDHVDTEALRQKYAAQGVDIDAIVEVDAVWGENTIAEALGPDRRVDYIIASHVVEHVPDLVAWLNELASVLKPGGTIRLAVPDRRFCFDYRREDTRVSDVLAAHLVGARRPQPREIIDFSLHHKDIDLGAAWDQPAVITPPDPAQLDHAFARARRAVAGEYVDVHCWAFTLAAFAAVMQKLAHVGLTQLACVRAFDAEVHENEFFVIMTPADPAEVVESWRRVEAEARAPDSPDPQTWPQARRLWLAQGHKTQVERYEAEIALLKRQLADLRQSTSWRITRPLRALVARLRGGDPPG